MPQEKDLCPSKFLWKKFRLQPSSIFGDAIVQLLKVQLNVTMFCFITQVFVIGFVVSLVKKRRSQVEGSVDRDDFESDDEELLRA